MAAAPWGAARTLWASTGHQSPVWEGDRGERRRTAAGALLSAVSGEPAERTAVEPSVAAAEWDRVGVSDPEAALHKKSFLGGVFMGKMGLSGLEKPS